MLPTELRSTASSSGMVRGNPFYALAANLFLPCNHYEEICKNLRAYADFWEVVIRAIRQTAQDNPREYELRLFAKRRLMAVVAEATGKPHYNTLAKLLNAAYDSVDLRFAEEASALRRLWENHVKSSNKRRYRRMALMMG